MNLFKQSLPVVLVFGGSVLACVSAQAAPQDCASVSPVERRIVERASGDDVASLRSFVGLTAIVYGINMIDVRENLDKWRAAVECRKQVAAAEQAAHAAVARQDEPAGDVAAPVVVSQR